MLSILQSLKKEIIIRDLTTASMGTLYTRSLVKLQKMMSIFMKRNEFSENSNATVAPSIARLFEAAKTSNINKSYRIKIPF